MVRMHSVETHGRRLELGSRQLRQLHTNPPWEVEPRGHGCLVDGRSEEAHFLRFSERNGATGKSTTGK